jgi:hypothetical protein
VGCRIFDRLMLMGVFAAIILLSLGIWQTYATFCRLRRCQVSFSWWLAFGALVITGIALGIWLAFFFEYQPTARLRVLGFPLPLVVFAWEEDQWIDFVSRSDVIIYSVCGANVVATVALVLLPVFLLSMVVHRKNSPEAK